LKPYRGIGLRKLNIKITGEAYLAILLGIILVVLKLFATGFYNVNNTMSILNRFSYLLIAAIGMNLIIITSNIDISTGALVSIICMVLAAAGKQGVLIWGLFPIAVICGILLSLLNGIIIAGLKIPSIVTTLAMAQLFQGGILFIFPGSIYDLPRSFTWLSFNAKLFGVMPISVVVMLVIAVIALVFMRYSRFSKKLYAVGNSYSAARLAGINVNRVIVQTYGIAGILFGITALIIATSSNRVTPTMGAGIEMVLIAAVVLGGTSPAGGKGRIIGTIIGALILAIISPAINYMKISPDWSDAVTGTIILVSMVVNAFNFKKKRKIK
jgi:ribose/xylose/arabinose/galactoside ABC-type transport system permease subunit